MKKVLLVRARWTSKWRPEPMVKAAVWADLGEKARDVLESMMQPGLRYDVWYANTPSNDQVAVVVEAEFGAFALIEKKG